MNDLSLQHHLECTFVRSFAHIPQASEKLSCYMVDILNFVLGRDVDNL